MIEIIGITASLFILICFTFNDERYIRIFDGIGALLYIIYGLLIGSFSNVFMNAVLIGIQIYKITKLKRSENGKQEQPSATSTQINS